MTRSTGIFFALLLPFLALAQGGDQQLRAQADQLFTEQRFAEAMPLYSQLVSLTPGDRGLNYRLGACMLAGSADKEQAISHLRFATDAPNTDPLAWYWLGRAYHLNYRFKEAQTAYQRFLGTADKKVLEAWPVEALMRQCRNGERLLSSLKEITVRNKVEVADADFFRFYDLADIGGKIVVLPEELMTSTDKKRKLRSLVYLPDKPGPIYFSSYGRDGATGRDIYRTQLMPDGTFAAPVKLAGYINTDQDEDYPFMHPDGKTFYFSSKGHNSMGGYDVFKASYDRGLDAFGRPENMDFAVNTPDDDIFYIVDGEQKEACFASGRNSKQGNLHVYRVATAQLPVVITVFKGTYASSIDPQDRKARIVVDDMLTQERVAEVRTDINGNYVLSVPRAGKYRYLVTCGPTGTTHGGVVEVPKADGPRAYRQELVLDRKGDLEQLTIRNYFDEPLGDDLIDLALDEIKRRARLDVSDHEPVVQQEVAEEGPTGDVMTRAGFTGDIDQAKAVKLAQDDAHELEAQAAEEEEQASEAFALAIDATNEAERAATQADELIKQAAAASDEGERNQLMVEAARQRQRSREASLRARAAYNTGQALNAATLSSKQKAATAAKLSTDLATTTAGGNDAATLPLLQTLKQRLDEKSRPDMGQEPVERARKQLTEQEKESARMLSVARSKRDDENELTDRVARLKREKEETRSRSRKDEIDRELGTLEPQLAALRTETIAAFNKASAAERQTAVARGQASLTRHLAQTGEHHAGAELTTEQAQQLGLRISGADQRIAALAIDERYDAQISTDAAQAEARLFDWGLASTADAIGNDRSATRAMERSTADDATVAASRSAGIAQPEVEDAALRSATIAQQPETLGGEEEQPIDAARSTEDRERLAEQVEPAQAEALDAQPSEADGLTPTSRDAAAQEATRTGSMSAAAGTSTTEQNLTHELAAKDRFVLENERAELQQLMSAERDRAKRDAMQARLEAIDAELVRRENEVTVQEPSTEADVVGGEESVMEVDLSRPLAVFAPDADEAIIVSQVYRDYADDLSAAERLPDADARADAINGIESMLSDSLRAEMQRQVAVLQLSPQQAETVLPRVDRLRRLRDEHVAAGERAITERQAELAAEPEQTEPMASPGFGAGNADGNDPINDRFIRIDRLATEVYASRIEHRSHAKGIDDAIALREADVARMDDLTMRIDSMEKQLLAMAHGKESDKLRRQADQLIDERFIIRTDLGQRSSFLMKEEWRTANDSLKRVEAMSAARGLAPDEPLLQMAAEAKAEAQRSFDAAAQLRKRADRIEDIMARDSLYRRAYRNELIALQQLDRAITVQNYLAGDQHRRGEQLAYEEVAARVLGLDRTELMAARAGSDGTRTQQMERAAGSEAESTAVAVPESEATSLQNSTEVGNAVDSARNPSTSAGSQVDTAEERSAAAARADEQRSEEPPASDTRTTGEQAAPTTTPAVASSAIANEIITRSEGRLSPSDLVPAEMYERYLSSQPSMVSPTALEPGVDPDLLALRVSTSQRAASDLEQRSADAADRANALTDSAATARKRQREELEALAARERVLADSLHGASQRELAQAREAELLRDEAQVAKALRDRLIKFYYLTPEEQQMVMVEGDASRYFQARARAMEQLEVAEEAAASAKSNREVSATLLEQARLAEQEAAAGRLPAAEATSRAQLLDARAAVLGQRADSLDRVAARLRGAADINERQASAMLQGMSAERSSELMAMEQRARRTESLLAESRDQAGQQRSAEPIVLNRPERAAPATAQQEAQRSEPIAEATAQPRAAEPRTAEPVTAARPFRMPEELVEDVFVLNAPATRREEPIPIDAPMPGGIVFKVQIGAFRKEIPHQAFSDMTPVMGETVGNGLVRYTAGLFTGFSQAAAAKDQVRERGYRDAFVVAYRDGQRIPLGEAMRASQAITAQRVQQPTAATGEQPQRVIQPATTAVQEPVTATITRPSAATTATPQEDATAILARYPETADAIVASFAPKPEAVAYYNVPGAAPARQVETVKGLFFTVQVGVYSKPVALDKLFNITPLNSELTETAKVRYTTGFYTDTEQARVRKDEAIVLGVKDAFVTAYLNGRRIPVREAQALLEKFGPAILAQP